VATLEELQVAAAAAAAAEVLKAPRGSNDVWASVREKHVRGARPCERAGERWQVRTVALRMVEGTKAAALSRRGLARTPTWRSWVHTRRLAETRGDRRTRRAGHGALCVVRKRATYMRRRRRTLMGDCIILDGGTGHELKLRGVAGTFVVV
jgi:hypothetical protein